ncbi:MAG: HEPN domain-containing protein [bacterium]|nr:HEPN domain-containing protein [bacterium]
MTDDTLRQQAMEWFERGDHDIETAQLLYDQHGYTDSIAYHIQQAIEKYLKGYLVVRGRKPPRVHELDTLLTLAARFEPDWYDMFIDLCEKATRYYLDDRYPPGPVPEYDREEIQKDLLATWKLIDTIRAKVGITDDHPRTR